MSVCVQEENKVKIEKLKLKSDNGKEKLKSEKGKNLRGQVLLEHLVPGRALQQILRFREQTDAQLFHLSCILSILTLN